MSQTLFLVKKKKIPVTKLLGDSFDFEKNVATTRKLFKEQRTKPNWQKFIIKKLLRKKGSKLTITPPIKPELELLKTKVNMFDHNQADLKFPNNIPEKFKKTFYTTGKIIVFYRDVGNIDEINNILTGSPYNLDGDIINSITNIKDAIEGDDYFVSLKNKCLEIIESITSFNLVISIMPIFAQEERHRSNGHILVGSNFDSSKEILGLNLYSKKYFTSSEDEEINLNFLAILEQVDDKLNMILSLNSISDKLKEYKNPPLSSIPQLTSTQGVATKAVASQPDEPSSENTVDFCNGEEIIDNYFSLKWDKIELEGISTEFKTFLIEPKKPTTKSRKLLSCIDGHPTRFVGYFRDITTEHEAECEIIWETDWEKDIISNSMTEEVPQLYQSERKSSAEVGYENNSTIKWIIKLNTIEDLIKAQIDIGDDGPLKIYNVPVENNNLFYALANSFIVSKIIDSSALSIPEKLISIEGNTVRPIYTNLRNKLKNLANQILKKNLDRLHQKFIDNITDDTNFEIYPQEDEELGEEITVLNSLAKQRLSLAHSLDTVNSKLDQEKEIHGVVSMLLHDEGVSPLTWSILQVEAICSFFNINIKIIINSSETAIQITNIDKTNAKIKFNLDSISLDGMTAVNEDKDVELFLVVVDRHFMSLVPYKNLEETSYNYLFQKGGLKVNVSHPTDGNKMAVEISDFHDIDSARIDDAFLEECHDYIQWLFPNKSNSYYGPGNSQTEIYLNSGQILISPKQLILTDNDVHFIKSDETTKLNSLKSLKRLLHFYGLRFIIENDSGIKNDYTITDFQDFKDHLKNIKIDVLADPQKVNERFANLLKKSHNYLRITRILQYLKYIGLGKLNKSIVKKFKEEINGGGLDGNTKIKHSLHEFWEKQI